MQLICVAVSKSVLALAVFFRLLFLIWCLLDSRNGYLINFQTQQTLINLSSSSQEHKSGSFFFSLWGKINYFKLLLSGLIAISSPCSIGITLSGPCKSDILYFRASCNLVKSSVHWMFVRLVSVSIPSFLALNAASVQSLTEFFHFKEENRFSE